MRQVTYGYRRELPGVTYDQATARVKEALKAEGFGVLSEIDVKATLKAKLGVDFQPYVILGACNPSLAHRAFTVEPEIGLYLPCNVVVAETAGGSEVQAANPREMFKGINNPALLPIAEEVAAKLQRVLERV